MLESGPSTNPFQPRVFLINKAHILHFQRIGTLEDDIYIFRIAENNLLEKIKGKLRKVVEFGDHGLSFFQVLFRKTPRNASRYAPYEVGGSSAQEELNLLRHCAGLDNLGADLQSHFCHYAQDIASSRIGIRTAYEIRGSQRVERRNVAMDEVSLVGHFPELMGKGRNLVAETAVNRLGAGHMVARRTYPADAGEDPGELFAWPSL